MRPHAALVAAVAVIVGCSTAAEGLTSEAPGSAATTRPADNATGWSETGSESAAAPDATWDSDADGMIDSTSLVPAERYGPHLSFLESFDGPDGLLTNEFAHWNPTRSDIVSSPAWDVTSGSLFVRNGAGWTGVPDRQTSEPRSEQGNGSAVFRALVTADIAANTSVTMRLRVVSYVDDSTSEDWDGAHILLRYEDEARLYTVSVARRDGTLAIKRKLPGGDANEGHYLTLKTAPSPVQIGQWHTLTTTVADVPGGVGINLWIDGNLSISAVDLGQDGGVIYGPGLVGLRGDNVELEFDDVQIAPLHR